MKPSTVLADEGILMPYLVINEQNVILKVTDKFIGSIDEPLEQGKVYSIVAEFESYCIEENQEPIKGYFLKVPHMKSCAIEIEPD